MDKRSSRRDVLESAGTVAAMAGASPGLLAKATNAPRTNTKPSSPAIPIWTVFELGFSSSGTPAAQFLETPIEVSFVSPSKRVKVVPAFWDGGSRWKLRFSPDEIGRWSYHVSRAAESGAGAGMQAGSFDCVPYSGTNPLFRHGSIGLSADRRHFEHADGTPFFWLGDTAWNGPLKADEAGWNTYLRDRAEKGFTAVQFVMTQWIAATGDADGRHAYSFAPKFSIDPAFFERLDSRIAEINQHGLVAAPVLIWDGPLGNRPASLNPGTSLSDDQIRELAGYMVARYAAYQTIWILAGDGDYAGSRSERWKEIGRAVFGKDTSRLATVHTKGRQWVPTEFQNEPWYGFVSYQSGHGSSPEALRWLNAGPPAQSSNLNPPRPVINLEPNYEGHLSYEDRKPFDAHAVRRAAYWSLLVGPPAGTSYGAHGVWSWETSPAVPLHHEQTGMARPWLEAIHFPGSEHMHHLKEFFASCKWWTLQPAPEVLRVQPGDRDPAEFVAVARSTIEDVIIVYLPVGEPIRLYSEKLPRPAIVRWFDPRAGKWIPGNSRVTVTGDLDPPDDQDWLAKIEPGDVR